MRARLRSALVGLGNVAWRYPSAQAPGRATTHLEAYGTAGIECVGGCDPDPQARSAFSAATALPAYAGLEELLERHRIDVLSICSPEAAHHAQVVTALGAGVPRIWLEKPPASTALLTRELDELARRRGATIAVNFFRRYHPSFRRLRQALSEGALGRLLRLRAQYSRGLLANGIHLLDLLHFVTGDRIDFTVAAAAAGEDAQHPEALLSGGEVRASIGGAPLPYHLQELEAVGELGRLRVTQGGSALWMDRAAPNPHYAGFFRLEEATAPVVAGDNPGALFPEVLDDLLAAHEAGRPPESSVSTAARAMALYEAIVDGVHDGLRR